MDWSKVHVGKHRQAISREEAAAQRDAGLTPGSTPDLHAPEISPPAERPEMHLHGDVAGSPYSANPGEISLKEAAERDAANREPPARAARDTRAREAEARRTGTPTEALASGARISRTRRWRTSPSRPEHHGRGDDMANDALLSSTGPVGAPGNPIEASAIAAEDEAAGTAPTPPSTGTP